MADTLSEPVGSPPAGWARKMPDSSELESPRVYAPIYVEIDALDKIVDAYSAALGIDLDAHMPMPDLGVTVVSLGGLVITGEAAHSQDPGHVARVILVAKLDAAVELVTAAGMEITVAPVLTPPGRLMHVKGPDGSVNEWLEYRPLPGERPKPRITSDPS